MFTIQLNEKGTHHLEVDNRHFQTLRDYALFRDLVDSTGYVTEQTLDKLKCNVRALIPTADDPKPLIDLCYEIIYHPKMKSYGLRHLILAYLEWEKKAYPLTPAEEQSAE